MDTYSTLDDTELVRLLTQQDPLALETIYLRYVKRLYNYAHQRIRSKEDCQEILQEVFESLWARNAELMHVTLLEPYLYRMVKYNIIRYYKRSKVRQKFVDYFTAFETDAVDPEEEQHELDTLRSALNGTIKLLPERCQEALHLRLDENLSLDEIAERMQISKVTVKSYMAFAMNLFREHHSLLYKSE